MTQGSVDSLKQVLNECTANGSFERAPYLFQDRCLSVGRELSKEKFFELFQSGCTRFPLFRVYRQGRLIPQSEYTLTRKLAGQNVEGIPDIDRIECLYSEGCTINFRFVDERLPLLRDLCEILAKRLKCRSHASCFITPARVPGLDPHYDLIDAFIVQISGMKLWRIWRSSHELPLKREPYEPDKVKQEIHERPPDWELTVGSGDILYLPRGFIHQVESVGTDDSVHVALDCDPVRRADVLRTVVRNVLSEMVSNPELRRCYTETCLIDEFLSRSAMEANLHGFAQEVRSETIKELKKLENIQNSVSFYDPTSGYRDLVQLLDS